MRVGAIMHSRCPKCMKGDVFRSTMVMNDDCPVCGTHYQREPGYFFGAWYINYALQLVILVPIIAVFYYIHAPVYWYFIVGVGVPLLFTVLIYRFARVLWLHLDQVINPRE